MKISVLLKGGIEVDMVKNNKAYRIAVYAVMFAFIFVAMMLDRVISLGLPSGISTAASVLLVTFSFCFLDDSWATGILAFTFFGLASFIKGFIYPEPIPVSVNPLVSVFPRILVGVITFSVYRLMLLCTKKMKNPYARQTVSMTAASFFGLAANTIGYLTAVNIYKNILGAEYSPVFAVIEIVIFTNIIPEYLVTLLAAPHVVLGVRRGMKTGVDGRNMETFPPSEMNKGPVDATSSAENNSAGNTANLRLESTMSDNKTVNNDFPAHETPRSDSEVNSCAEKDFTNSTPTEQKEKSFSAGKVSKKGNAHSLDISSAEKEKIPFKNIRSKKKNGNFNLRKSVGGKERRR